MEKADTDGLGFGRGLGLGLGHGLGLGLGHGHSVERVVTPLCVMKRDLHCQKVTSDMQGMIWGEPELTMVYALLWDVVQ